MIDPIFLELSKYGGGTALIIALVFLVREIGRVWKSKNGGQEIERLKKKVDNDYQHELDRVWQEIGYLRQEFSVFKRDIYGKVEKQGNDIIELKVKRGA